jgi:hypothetical protein
MPPGTLAEQPGRGAPTLPGGAASTLGALPLARRPQHQQRDVVALGPLLEGLQRLVDAAGDLVGVAVGGLLEDGGEAVLPGALVAAAAY